MSNNDKVNVHITEEIRVVKYATVIVNGTERGKREINGTPTLSEFSKAIATEFGIKTFTVSVDGENVTTQTQAEALVREEAKVAVTAKDSRGARRSTHPTTDQTTQTQADAPQPEPSDPTVATEPTTEQQSEASASGEVVTT